MTHRLDPENAPLALRLFGPFDARVRGEPLPRLRSRKGAWLLSLLALRAGRSVQRSWLAGTLWPDSEEADAFYSLRRSLTDLRAALGAEAVRIQSPTSQSLRLDLQGCWADVLHFDAALLSHEEEALAAGVDLYRGPLLEGCNEEWCLPERASREEALLGALQRLAVFAAERGDRAAAIHRWRRMLTVDAYRESAVAALMQLHVDTGDFAAAVRAFLDLRRLLKRELGTEPSLDLQQRFEEAQRLSRTQTSEVSSAEKRGFRLPPAPLTPFLGRQEEVEAVSGLLTNSRLVTLVGPGGIGKTRLALAVAETAGTSRVLFADLSVVRSDSAVMRELMRSAGQRESGREPTLVDLQHALSTSPTLLIVDNCEHVISAAAAVLSEVLHECAGLQVLATSRQALRLAGERPYSVPPLGYEAKDDGESAAVALFVQHARAANPAFRLSEENRSAVAAICRRLEGIPLAIELAASRTRLLSPDQIAARLDDRFSLLAGGVRDAPERHQTLRAALDWSYDLLDSSEQRLFRRLALLTGSWALEAATALGGDASESVLESLIEKSLVITESDGPECSFRMLETLREYGLERLAQAGERHEALGALLSWAVGFAEAAAEDLRTPKQHETLRRLDRAYPNLRTALDESPSGERESRRLSAALWRYWDLRGHWVEGLRSLNALDVEEEVDPSTAAELLLGLGVLRRRSGDFPGAEEALSASLELFRGLNSDYGKSAALHELGLIALHLGRPSEAEAAYRESWELAERTEDLVHLAALANDRGEQERARGRLDEAEALFAKCLDLSRRMDDLRGMAGALANLGNLATEREEYDEALLWAEESLEHLTVLGDRWGRALVLCNLGFAHLGLGLPERAEACFRESAETRQELRDATGLAHCFAGLSAAASLRGDDSRAALFHGALDALRDGEGIPLDPVDQRLWERLSDAARQRMGAAVYRKAWRRGRYADRQTLLKQD